MASRVFVDVRSHISTGEVGVFISGLPMLRFVNPEPHHRVDSNTDYVPIQPSRSSRTRRREEGGRRSTFLCFGILGGHGLMNRQDLSDYLLVGELSLDGKSVRSRSTPIACWRGI